MELHRTSMLIRIFLFCDELCCHFGSEGVYYWPPRKTNSCQFIRVVFVWAPLILMANLATIVLILFTTIYLPVQLFGWGYGWFWLIILGASAAVALVVWAIWLVKKLPYAMRLLPQPMKDAGALVVVGYRGFKDRFCPLIKFQEDV